MASLKVFSNNVKGLRATFKRKKIFHFLNTLNCDFFCLQETHSDKDIEKEWSDEWCGKIAFSHGATNSLGVAILYKDKHKILHTYADSKGRFVSVTIQIEDKKILLIALYAPNIEREQKIFFNEIHSLILDAEYDELILTGDFNICLNNSLDKKGGNSLVKRSLPYLQRIISDFSLIDSWRKNNPGKKQYTWKQNNPEILCRLDYFLVTKKMDEYVQETKITHVPNTDHKGITIDIELHKAHRRGPSFWKHNNSLLNNKTYVNEMRKKIDDAWKEAKDVSDIRAKYDFLKYKIKQFSIVFSKQLAKDKRKCEENCQKRLQELDVKLMEDSLSKEEKAEYNKITSTLESIYDEKTKGEIVRSKIDQIEEGEKSTTFFFKQAKQNYERKTIEKLSVADEILTDKKRIQEEVKQFYVKLYSSTHNQQEVQEELTLDPRLGNLEQVTEEQNRELKKEMSQEELFQALKDSKSNKSPGSDGLSAEFYRMFWKELGPKVTEVINFSLEKRELPLSFRQGVITLLQKPNKDPLLIKNYRPISLLNCDYKLLSKAVANRLSKVIPKLVRSDQTAFIKGRYIGENIRVIEDIMDYVNRNNQQAMLLQLDFEKAYDSIEWPYLFATLKKFKFCDEIIDKIKLLYTNIFSTIVNDGYSCGWFRLQRGVRQGCPLSCILFILCVEILAELIRNTAEIKGLKINDKEKKISQFADDTSCIIADEPSARKLFEVTEAFSCLSGLKLNKDKCEILWLGTKQEDRRCILGIGPPKECVDVLGVRVGYNAHDCVTHNYHTKIRRMENRLQRWTQRNLSILGRILLAKAQGMSNLIYTLSTQFTDVKWIAEAHKCIRNFIWNNRPPKVKHSTLITNQDRGGLRAPDIFMYNKAIKLAWIKRILEKPNWNIVLENQIAQYGNLILLLRCNIQEKKLPVAPFYQQIIKFFREIFKVPHNNEIIWNNKHVKAENKTIFWLEWYEKGIVCYNQLVNADLTFISREELIRTFDVSCDIKTYRKFRTSVLRGARIHLKTHALPFTAITKEMLERTVFQSKTGNLLDLRRATCKEYYNECIELWGTDPTAFEAWRTNYQIPQQVLCKSFHLNKKSCQDRKLLAFQYKVINNVVANNLNLKKWGIKDSDSCSFCNETDTVYHMFCECNTTREIIKSIYDLANLPLNSFNKQDFIFGTNESATNLIFLVAKNIIWKCRFYNKQFLVIDFVREMQLHIQADANRLSDDDFRIKWEKYVHLLEL